MHRILVSILIASTLVFAPVAFAATEVNTYKVPDVKDDYCGVEINYQYCKCAFHDEYCADVGLDENDAYSYVLNAFRGWNRERIQMMGEQCLAGGGYWNKSKWSCTTCTDGDVLKGSRCVESEKADDTKKECELPPNFDGTWQKYSDFDDAISASDASYEVGQYNQVLDEIAKLVAEAQALEYDMEIDREIRLELREYKKALVQNIRNNITKAIFRLAWVTYNNVQAGSSAAGTYRTLLEPENAVEGFGAAMKLVQAHIPKHEKELQFDTSDTEGKVKSIAWNATLETIESVGNPSAVAQQVVKDVKGAITGGPDLTDEEIAILAQQHNSNQAVDKALAESYARNAERRKRLLTLEKEISEKYNELQEWKAKEYTRVRSGILENCE